jgi:hypothetical protein
MARYNRAQSVAYWRRKEAADAEAKRRARDLETMSHWEVAEGPLPHPSFIRTGGYIAEWGNHEGMTTERVSSAVNGFVVAQATFLGWQYRVCNQVKT